jgi:hypothetical protein
MSYDGHWLDRLARRSARQTLGSGSLRGANLAGASARSRSGQPAARGLEPMMTRRRSLAWMGGGVGSLALSSATARSARADLICVANGGACDPSTPCGSGCKCCLSGDQGVCTAEANICCPGRAAFCFAGEQCCPPGSPNEVEGVGSGCCSACPPGTTPCGSNCCNANTELCGNAATGQCVPSCPPDTEQCGSDCCSSPKVCVGSGASLRCVNPCEVGGGFPCGDGCCFGANVFCLARKCVQQCPADEEACGNGNCCPSGSTCNPDGSCRCKTDLCGAACCRDGSFCCNEVSGIAPYCCGPAELKRQHKQDCASRALDASDTGANYVVCAQLPVPGVDKYCNLASAAATKQSNKFQRCANDPPDSHYRSIVRPRLPHFPSVQSAHGINGAAAKAVNRMFVNQVRADELLSAWITSVERAQGAANARNRRWIVRQMKAAAKFADQAADAYTNDVTLRRQARKALQKSGAKEFTITVAQARAAQQTIRNKGLPAAVISALRKLGVTQHEIDALRAHILVTPASRFARPVLLAPLTDPTTLRNDRHVAADLRAFAKSARRKQIVPVPGSHL